MITIDEQTGVVTVRNGAAERVMPMASPEAFDAVSRAWLRCGWDTKYVYGFTWMGRRVIQLPDDMLRVQEVIFRVKPDVVIETGVAHGGSLVFYASLLKAMDRGRVVGIDIEIRPANRAGIEAHPLKPLITLIEGSSTDPDVVRQAAAHVKPGDTVLVLLDSNHTKEHVLAELEAYAPLVTPGSYIVATDGIMGDLAHAPRGKPEWQWNNPREAAREFVAKHPNFVFDEPEVAFDDVLAKGRVTYWPDGFMRRVA